MLMIVWNDRFVLGVQQFDEHHQHLVGLLNQAYNNFIVGAHTESVESILNELVD
jgi:hemerythrin